MNTPKESLFGAEGLASRTNLSPPVEYQRADRGVAEGAMVQSARVMETGIGLDHGQYGSWFLMNANGLQVTSGSPVLLVAERTPQIRRLALHLEDRCQLRVEQVFGSVGPEDFEAHPNARVIIAAPARLTGLLPHVAGSMLRWRYLFFLIERDQLLEAANYARWADGFIFPEAGSHVCDALVLASEGVAVLPPYMSPSFSLDAVRIDQLETLDAIELQVLSCLGCGLPNSAIGERLGLSQTHVKSVVRSLLRALHFRNRTEGGVFARLARDSVARAKSMAERLESDSEPLGSPNG